MDPIIVTELAASLDLRPEDILALQQARIDPRKEQLFAATPRLHGLQLWVNGEWMVLLDEKGFLTQTLEPEDVLRLCKLESTLGPGACRVLLGVPVVDAAAAITALDARFRLQPKPVEARHTAPAPKASKIQLSAEVFNQILLEI